MKSHVAAATNTVERAAVAATVERAPPGAGGSRLGERTDPHAALQARIDQSPRMAEQRRAMQAVSGRLDAAADRTGLPTQLRAGIESLSGMDMSAVHVHRNSAMPAQLSALAYAQGSEIHLGPGQERQLPHEAWHVVQQRQGRVTATTQMAGVAVNDEAGLEREADAMGRRAVLQGASTGTGGRREPAHSVPDAVGGKAIPQGAGMKALGEPLIQCRPKFSGDERNPLQYTDDEISGLILKRESEASNLYETTTGTTLYYDSDENKYYYLNAKRDADYDRPANMADFGGVAQVVTEYPGIGSKGRGVANVAAATRLETIGLRTCVGLVLSNASAAFLIHLVLNRHGQTINLERFQAYIASLVTTFQANAGAAPSRVTIKKGPDFDAGEGVLDILRNIAGTVLEGTGSGVEHHVTPDAGGTARTWEGTALTNVWDSDAPVAAAISSVNAEPASMGSASVVPFDRFRLSNVSNDRQERGSSYGDNRDRERDRISGASASAYRRSDRSDYDRRDDRDTAPYRRHRDRDRDRERSRSPEASSSSGHSAYRSHNDRRDRGHTRDDERHRARERRRSRSPKSPKNFHHSTYGSREDRRDDKGANKDERYRDGQRR